MSSPSPGRTPSRGDGYSLLTSDEALAQAAARQPMRPTTIAVIGLGLLSFFYVTARDAYGNRRADAAYAENYAERRVSARELAEEAPSPSRSSKL